MKKLATILAILAVSLCISSCKTVRTYYYLINTDIAVPKAEKQLPLTAAVNNVRAPSRYQDQMVYRTSDYEVGFYEYSQWVEQPAEMVRRGLLNALKDSGLFKRVDSIDIVVNPDLTLQSSIVCFDQVVAKEGNFAECEFRLELLGSSGQTVWSCDAKAHVAQKRKGTFVEAMSEAVSQAIKESLADMEKSAALQKFAEGKNPKSQIPNPKSQD
jgi:ABC-type uncharacterized transport system auxiliary subunit